LRSLLESRGIHAEVFKYCKAEQSGIWNHAGSLRLDRRLASWKRPRQAEADAYSAKLIEECVALKGDVDSYRFTDHGKDIFALWKAMMETSETGEVYSTAMIDVPRPGIGKAASSVQ
jgi:hypothetical protein